MDQRVVAPNIEQALPVVDEQRRPALNNLNEEELNDDDDSDIQEEEEALVDEAPGGQEEEPLPAIMGQDDRRRMRLSTEEAEWALYILDAIELHPEMDDQIDYWYAQLALICKDNVNQAVERAKGLQAFRETYGIRHTYQEGCRALQVYTTELLPRLYLDFFYCATKGTYVMAENGAKFRTAQLTSREQADQVLVGVYYFLLCCCPDLESIRKGVICLTDCGNMSLTTRQDYNLLIKLFDELISVYPMTGSFLYYNVGVLCNVALSTMKSFLPKDLKERFQTGLTFEGGLEAHCMVPDAFTATQRVVRRMQDNLRRRFENEKNFSLPT